MRARVGSTKRVLPQNTALLSGLAFAITNAIAQASPIPTKEGKSLVSSESSIERLKMDEVIYAVFPTSGGAPFRTEPLPTDDPLSTAPTSTNQPPQERPLLRWKESPDLFAPFDKLTDAFPDLEKIGIPKDPEDASALWNETDNTLYVKASRQTVMLIGQFFDSSLCGGRSSYLKFLNALVELAPAAQASDLKAQSNTISVGQPLPESVGKVVARFDAVGRSGESIKGTIKPSMESREGVTHWTFEGATASSGEVCDITFDWQVAIPHTTTESGSKGRSFTLGQASSLPLGFGQREVLLITSPVAPDRRFAWLLGVDIVYPETSFLCGNPTSSYKYSEQQKKWLAQGKH